jgi:hypothetical protein
MEEHLSDKVKETNNSVPDYSEIERILTAGSDTEKRGLSVKRQK